MVEVSYRISAGLRTHYPIVGRIVCMMAMVKSEVIPDARAMTQRRTDMVACADIEVVARVCPVIDDHFHPNENVMGVYDP
jgi:hypothetical protein